MLSSVPAHPGSCSGCARGGLRPPDFLVLSKLAYVYNPYTHYVVAYMSSDQAPNTIYGVYYKVDGNGLLVSGTAVTPLTFTY